MKSDFSSIRRLFAPILGRILSGASQAPRLLLPLLAFSLMTAGAVMAAEPTDAAEQQEAAKPPPEIRAGSDIKPQRCLIGDPLIYTISATAPIGIKITSPAEFDQGPFTLIERLPEETSDSGGERTYTFRYQLALFGTGRAVLPEQQIGYYQPGGEVETVSVPPAVVDIDTLLPPPATDGTIDGEPDPIAAPLDLEVPDYRPLIAIVLFLATFIIIWLLYRYSQKYTPQEQAARLAPPDPRSAAERARDRLREVEIKRHPENGKIKEHYSETAFVIRAYLGERFGFDSLDLTSYELMFEVRTYLNDSGKLDAIRSFFDLCDLVKFAKYQPSPNETNGLIGWAGSLIEDDPRPTEEDQENDELAEAEPIK